LCTGMTWLSNRQREDKIEENDGRTTNEVVASIQVAEPRYLLFLEGGRMR
jgi:hypothetical protein